jgi:hypothetical protein
MFRKRSTANQTKAEDMALVPLKAATVDANPVQKTSSEGEESNTPAQTMVRGKRNRGAEETTGEEEAPLPSPASSSAVVATMVPRSDLTSSVMAPRGDVMVAEDTPLPSQAVSSVEKSGGEVTMKESSARSGGGHGPAKPPPGTCGPYWKSGKCPYGDGCKYAHINSSGPIKGSGKVGKFNWQEFAEEFDDIV